MLYECSRYGENVQKLRPIDDAKLSIQYTELIGVAYPCTDYVCLTCARDILGISKANIGKVIIETIFKEFGYEVYPYGYESYLTNIIKFMRKVNANIPARKIRATPDLFIYDRELNDGFFVEIKTTNTPNENELWISRHILHSYLEYWEEAVLVIYCMRTMNIYCIQIKDIHTADLRIDVPSIDNIEKYVLNMQDTFYGLPDQFRLVEPEKFKDLIQRMRIILRQFNTI